MRSLLTCGNSVGPRGYATHELLNWTLDLHDSTRNILAIPSRRLNYKYMVAEWLWIQFGHSDVRTIKQYNSQLTRFSDDGVFFTGAYGPHFGGGWHRMMDKLRRDPDTRQAVLQVPRPQVETKDEPCTLSLQFIKRYDRLHCIATMRSSDIYLGVPYDVFTFTQIQNVVAGELGLPRGFFRLQMASSHLYDSDIPKAMKVLSDDTPATDSTPDLPGRPPAWLDDVLISASLEPIPSSVDKLNDPWMRYANALVAPSWGAALWELTTKRPHQSPVHIADLSS